MSTVLVKDLKEYRKKTLVTDVGLKLGDMNIKVKQHTSIMDKVDFAFTVYKKSIKRDNGLHIIDKVLYDVAYKVGIIKRYTNITLPADGIVAYDLVVNTGIYDEVYNSISEIEKKELERIVGEYIDEKHQEYLQENSTGHALAHFGNLINKEMEGMLDNFQAMIQQDN